MIETRLATGDDAEVLSEMNAEFNEVRMEPGAISSKLLAGREIVAIASTAGAIVGFACAQICESICYPSPYAEITELFVRAASRRSGVGTALVAFVEKQVAQRGATHIRILTGMRNQSARALYAKLGYRHDRNRPEVLYEKDMAGAGDAK